MDDKSGKKRKTVQKIFNTLTAPATGSKRIKQALEVSEEKYRSAFEYTQTGMVVLEEDMTISLINQKISEMTGYSKEEIEGKVKWTNMVAQKDCARMMEYHQSRRAHPETTPSQYEFKYRHTSGTYRDALLEVSMIPGTTQSLVSMMDITERKKIEKELHESDRRFKETTELLPSMIVEMDSNFRVIYANKASYDTFGYSMEDFRSGVSLPQMIHPEDLERAKDNIQKKIAGLDFKPQEYRLQKKNGEIVYCLVASSPILKSGELAGVRTSLLDITELKLVEKKLRLSEEHLKSIYAASPIGIVLCDQDGAITDANRSFMEMFSLDREADYKEISFSLFDQIPGIKKQSLDKKQILAFESAFDFRFSKQGDCYEIIPTKGRFLSWNVTPIQIEVSGPILYLGQVQDVTARKKAEERKLRAAKHAADKANKMVEGLRKEILGSATFHSIISRSPAMKEIFNILPEIAQTMTTVLVTGESGTGKELIARSIHELSPRANAPFVAINCGALPDNLLESELFGYLAGAFTDAKKDKPGKFVQAEGGTLFLDEIGDITPAMQVKLLRVLQEKIVEPLGGTKGVPVDVRVVAATNKNIPQMVEKKEFREDLYYRIKVLNLTLPPLRDRKGDIPLLCDYFISLFNARYKKSISELSDKSLDVLIKYDYPGNIRELENIIEHAFIFCKTDSIDPKHLPPEMTSKAEQLSSNNDILSGVHSFEELEKIFILRKLQENNGSRINTAKQLGIHKATLFRKMKSLGIAEN